jgi:hypothetical protein
LLQEVSTAAENPKFLDSASSVTLTFNVAQFRENLGVGAQKSVQASEEQSD